MSFDSRGAALLAIGMLAGALSVAPRPCAAEDATGPLVAQSASSAPAVASAPGAPAAPDSAPAPPAFPAWLAEITLHGFLSTSYSYNFDRPASGTNQFRVFDFDDNTFKLDEVELVAQKAAAKPRDSGFRVDLTVGSSVPRVTASAGLFRDASGAAGDIDIHQAFASYVAPLGSGLRFDLGKFITSHGYEVIDGYDNWNDNATRSILFGYAIPFTHVGVRASYAFSPRASGTLMLVNGWDVARDNNRSKSVGAQIMLSPVAPLTLWVSGMSGPEKSGNDGDRRDLIDAVAVLKPNGRFTLGANFDWGAEQNPFPAGAGGSGPATQVWSGAAGYVRIAVTEAFALSLRGEYFDDSDGLRTGVGQVLREFTATPELRLTPRLLLRGDARADRSSQPVFEKSQGFAKTQPTVLVSALYTF